MLNDPTTTTLTELALLGMRDAFVEQQSKPDFTLMAFDERFAMLTDAERLYRQNRKLKRHLEEAKLKLRHAALEDLDYSPKRELDKAVMRQLATCAWVEHKQGIVITGATGTGKTFLACALAQAALRKGHRAMYRRATRFFDEVEQARADGTYPRLLSRIAKIDVLILDDWGLARIEEAQRRDLMEVLDDRHGERSTILTSQLPTSKWHDYLGDPTIADAICERLLHRAHKLALKGPSRRKEDDKK
jgi:DNA replication protein DnaC